MELGSFCNRWLAAWTGNDPELLISFYSEDVYYRDPANPHGLKGRRPLYDYLKVLLRGNPDWKWEKRELLPTEKGFVLKWRATIPTHQGVITEEGLDIVEITKNLISRNEVFFDRTELLKKLESSQ